MGIGCYPLQAALIAFNHEEPESIVATGFTREFQGQLTDTTGTIILLFKNNRMAVLNCLGEDMEAIHSLKIHGTEGRREEICIFFFKILFFHFRCC